MSIAPSSPAAQAEIGSTAWLGLVLFTVVAPLIAFNLTPSATLFNQLAALAGAGGLLFAMAIDQPRWRSSPAAWALLALLIGPLASCLLNGLPLSLTLSGSALIGTALLLVLAGQGLDESARRRWFAALCWGLLAAGLLSLLVSVIQVFWPALPDGNFIARSGIPGRAVGNMRQPNHLASLMMWSCVAAVYLADQSAFKRIAGRSLLPVLLFGFVFTVILSASRTGMVGVLLLAIWGLLDRKLRLASRWALLATPLMMAVSWYLMYLWANSGAGHAFGAESRLVSEGAGSPERMKILVNAWELVKRNPWTGVGWGEFNLAWTMTPFPNRPIAFFDHTHDLPLQLAVELGLPAALLIVGLLCWALWRAFRDSMLATQAADAVVRRCAFMLVLMIGLHSLLEYPLWYAYFLLPTAFAFGLALGPRTTAPAHRGASLQGLLRVVGVVVMVGSLYALWDYSRVVVIYVPPQSAAPLPQRIEEGQRSTFFAPQADYAAATSLAPGAKALEATHRTAHNLIDVRLMMSWAQSLHATGDDDRARYVVQRLREFRNAMGEDWLAICKVVTKPEEQPFQCAPPSREYDWKEMR